MVFAPGLLILALCRERKKIEAVVEARRREIEAGVEIAKEQISETARRYAAVALEALAVTAVYGEGMARVQAARELLELEEVGFPTGHSSHFIQNSVLVHLVRDRSWPIRVTRFENSGESSAQKV